MSPAAVDKIHAIGPWIVVGALLGTAVAAVLGYTRIAMAGLGLAIVAQGAQVIWPAGAAAAVPTTYSTADEEREPGAYGGSGNAEDIEGYGQSGTKSL